MIATLRHHITHAHTLDLNKTIKSITFYTWIAAAVLFAAYVYFVGAITFAVVKERGLQEQTKSLISSMGQQELAYLNRQKALTESYALEHGFISAQVVSFAPAQRAFAWNVGR